MLSPNQAINDPVPRNVSKYPIHQTYLTDDAQLLSGGGYQFKAPEVWSSARSGKKSVGIRSIKWIPKQINLEFSLKVHDVTNSTNETINIGMVVPPFTKTQTILEEISKQCDEYTTAHNNDYEIDISFANNQVEIQAVSNASYTIGLTKSFYTSGQLPNSFDEIFNQPYSANDTNYYDILVIKNVWDRCVLNFHASFIPFDTYQYLGDLGDIWQKPIIYQDPNASALFKVWTTLDLKTPFHIYHESFIIRISFIISSENSY